MKRIIVTGKQSSWQEKATTFACSCKITKLKGISDIKLYILRVLKMTCGGYEMLTMWVSNVYFFVVRRL